MGNTRVDLVGKRFGRLVVIRRAGCDKKGNYSWDCVCDCGGTRTSRMSILQRGDANSCGCLARENAAKQGYKSRTHGLSLTPEYKAWRSMLERCTDENHRFYQYYGGRGIGVSKEWMSLEQFFADMGPKPSKYHELDRIDNNKGYSKENCRWATKKQNTRNRRCNALVSLNGREVTIAEAAEKTGLNYTTIYFRSRERGLTQETGLFRPVG